MEDWAKDHYCCFYWLVNQIQLQVDFVFTVIVNTDWFNDKSKLKLQCASNFCMENFLEVPPKCNRNVTEYFQVHKLFLPEVPLTSLIHSRVLCSVLCWSLPWSTTPVAPTSRERGAGRGLRERGGNGSWRTPTVLILQQTLFQDKTRSHPMRPRSFTW